MTVVEELLAEMALNAPEPPPCHFTRLPLELRKRIYALLLLAPPIPRIHCSITPYTKQCSPGGRFLASTCKPHPTCIRTVNCGTCEWRGGDIHTAILSVNHAIYSEATSVLYENSQILFLRQGSASSRSMGSENRSKIRRVVFAQPPGQGMSHISQLQNLPHLRVLELHFDVDLTKIPRERVSVEHFGALVGRSEVELVVDVHIIRAWDDPSGNWGEPVTRREDVSGFRVSQLDEAAAEMREEFIRGLGEIFKARGKTLVVRDN